MGLFRRAWYGARGPIKEQTLLSRAIKKRNSKVACIGGFGDPSSDPTAAFFAQKTRRHSVFLVDCNDKQLLEKLRGLQKEMPNVTALQKKKKQKH